MAHEKEIVRVGKEVDLPLTGAIAFGVIDRGTNLLQIRPSSGCNLCCPFCSVDEGPCSETKVTRFIVELDYMLDYAQAVASRKNCDNLEMHIDGCGEPMMYPEMVGLVEGLNRIEKTKIVSMQTNGTLLSREKIEELEEAGLDRINLTINSLDSGLAKRLAGVEKYDPDHVLEMAKVIAESEIDLLVAPVWMEGMNDEEIPEIIEFAQEIESEGVWPRLGIQKYREHKRGRKIDSSSEVPWERFYEKMGELEDRYGEKLVLSPKDFGIQNCEMALDKKMKKGEKLGVRMAAPGWNRNQKTGVARHRSVTVVNAAKIPLGRTVRVEILGNKHNLYLARPV